MSLGASPHCMLDETSIVSPSIVSPSIASPNHEESIDAIVELEPGEIMNQSNPYLEAFEWCKKLVEDRRRPYEFLNKHNQKRILDLQIKLHPTTHVKSAEVDMFAYFGKHFDCMNHIPVDSHTWRQTYALSELNEVETMLDAMEGKTWD